MWNEVVACEGRVARLSLSREGCRLSSAERHRHVGKRGMRRGALFERACLGHDVWIVIRGHPVVVAGLTDQCSWLEAPGRIASRQRVQGHFVSQPGGFCYAPTRRQARRGRGERFVSGTTGFGAGTMLVRRDGYARAVDFDRSFTLFAFHSRTLPSDLVVGDVKLRGAGGTTNDHARWWSL